MAQSPQRNLPPEATQWAKWVERQLTNLDATSKNNTSKIKVVQSSQQHNLNNVLGIHRDQEDMWNTWELERQAIADNIEEQLNAPQQPLVPTISNVTTEAYWDDAGQPRANATVTWLQVNYDSEDGQLLGLTNYEVKIEGLIEYVQGIPIDVEYDVGEEPDVYNSVTFENLPAGTELKVSIRAMGELGGVSEWSAPYTFTTAGPAMTLLPPTAPMFRTENGAVEIRWNGLLYGEVTPPTYFSHCLVQFREKNAEEWIEYSQDTGWVITGLTAGEVYEARLIAVDMLGRKSDPSVISSVTVKSSVKEALDLANQTANELDAEKIRIQKALDDAFEAKGGVEGALQDIQTLDERLSGELQEARTDTEQASDNALQALQNAAKNIRDVDTFYTITEVDTGGGVAPPVTPTGPEPTSEWTNAEPFWVSGQHVWWTQRTVKGDGSVTWSQPVRMTSFDIAGDAYDAAAEALIKANSTPIHYELEYALGTAGAVTGEWQDHPPTVPEGSYLWQRTVVTYGNNDVDRLAAIRATGDKGDDGSGIEIAGSVATYANLPSGLGAGDAGKGYLVEASGLLYIWDGTQFPAEAQGVEFRGPQGDPGSNGVSITGLVPYWKYVNAGAAAPAKPSVKNPGDWSTSEPAGDTTKDLYRTDRVDYSDGLWQWTSVQKVSSFQIAKEAMTVAANLRASVEAGLTRFAKESNPPAPFKGGTWVVLDDTGTSMIGLREANSAGTDWNPYQIIVEDLMVVGPSGTIQLKDNTVTAGTIVADEQMKAKLASFIEVEAGKVTWDDAAGNTAFIINLMGETAFFDKLSIAGVISVGGPNKVGTTLIEPEAITTTLLAAESVDATKIKAEALDAFVITAPEIQSVKASERGIKWSGSTLIGYTNTGAEAFRLDGTRATITAGTIQTAASGARVVLDTGGLKAYNALGLETTSITGATGSVSGWSLSGSTITGGLIRTAETGQRIQINSEGLRAYNAAGTVTASILSGVGSFTGAQLDATDITGGTITGALIQTVGTSLRGVKMSSNGLFGYNASNIQTFSIASDTGLVTVTGGTLRSTSGTARVELNSTGLKAYNSSGTLTSSIAAGSGSFTGATITGGTIQTVSTASRGVKITSAGLQGWNNSGVLSAKISADGTDNLLVGRLYTSSPGNPGMIISKTSAGLPGILFSADGTTDDKHAAIYADDTYSVIFRGTTTDHGTSQTYAPPVTQGLTVLGPTTTTGSSYALVDVLQKNGRNTAVRIGWANETGTLGEVWSNDVIANGRLQDFNPPTTTSAANVYMNPTSGTNQGRLYRSTSVRAAKVDIQDVGTDPNRLLDVAVRDWWDRTQLKDYTDLLEEHALHKAGVRDKPQDHKPKYPRRIPGVVAEELEEAGLGSFCTYDENTGELVGVMYDRIPLLLIPIVREQRDTIARLEQRISALGG